MTGPLLSVDALQVRYGGVPALHGVSIDVLPGEAVALIGANGAGKSTLMKAIIGLMPASAGAIRFDGQALGTWPANRRARAGIGYCPEGRRSFPGLTVRENLSVACWGGSRLRAERLASMYDMFPALAEYASTLAWQLSGGQQQMLAMARSLMGAPRLLLLDEPSLGLSPRLTDEVLGRIPAIVGNGTSVLMAEQNASKALQVCRRAVVLNLGKVTLSGLAADLAQSAEVRRAFLGV